MSEAQRGGRSYHGFCQQPEGCPEPSKEVNSWHAAEAWAKRHAEKHNHQATAESYVRYFPGDKP